jgi:hypothetical protein
VGWRAAASHGAARLDARVVPAGLDFAMASMHVLDWLWLLAMHARVAGAEPHQRTELAVFLLHGLLHESLLW